MTVRHPEKVNNIEYPIQKKPAWIRVKASHSNEYIETKNILKKNNLITVCEEASCPNINECWSKKHATFMIMGDTCTRACAFCNVKTGIRLFFFKIFLVSIYSLEWLAFTLIHAGFF